MNPQVLVLGMVRFFNLFNASQLNFYEECNIMAQIVTTINSGKQTIIFNMIAAFNPCTRCQLFLQ